MTEQQNKRKEKKQPKDTGSRILVHDGFRTIECESLNESLDEVYAMCQIVRDDFFPKLKSSLSQRYIN